jgi:hypothetical protein
MRMLAARRYFFQFLAFVDSYGSTNKMTAENLAIVFGPVVLKRKYKALFSALSLSLSLSLSLISPISLSLLVVGLEKGTNTLLPPRNESPEMLLEMPKSNMTVRSLIVNASVIFND